MTKTTPSAENIAAFYDEAKLIPALLSGVLDDRIAELKALNAELDEKRGIAATVEHADRILVDAKAQSAAAVAAAREEIAKMHSEAQAQLNAAGFERGEVKKLRTEAEAMKAAVLEREQQLDATETRLAAATAELERVSEGLDKRQRAVSEAEAAVAADRALVNQRLDALRLG